MKKILIVLFMFVTVIDFSKIAYGYDAIVRKVMKQEAYLT